MDRLQSFAVLAMMASACACGCTSNAVPQKSTQTAARDSQQTVEASARDPQTELRRIAEKGKAQGPSSAGERHTFVDVRVESKKSTALTYTYVGRIIADYANKESGRIDRVVVYFKYDGAKWVFSKYDRGAGGGAFPGPLTEDLALSPSSIAQFNTPAPSSNLKFSIWLP